MAIKKFRFNNRTINAIRKTIEYEAIMAALVAKGKISADKARQLTGRDVVSAGDLPTKQLGDRRIASQFKTPLMEAILTDLRLQQVIDDSEYTKYTQRDAADLSHITLPGHKSYKQARLTPRRVASLLKLSAVWHALNSAMSSASTPSVEPTSFKIYEIPVGANLQGWTVTFPMLQDFQAALDHVKGYQNILNISTYLFNGPVVIHVLPKHIGTQSAHVQFAIGRQGVTPDPYPNNDNVALGYVYFGGQYQPTETRKGEVAGVTFTITSPEPVASNNWPDTRAAPKDRLEEAVWMLINALEFKRPS